jgi:transcriptional regulator with XRE-family HTH domain
MKVPVIDLAATGQNIKNLRVAAGISVRDLQAILGFTNPQAIYKWQNGDCMPSIDNLVILAAVLGVTIDELIVVDGDSDGDGDNTGSGKADLNRSAFEKCLQQILVYDS